MSLRRTSLTLLALNIMMLLFVASALVSAGIAYDPASSQEPMKAVLLSVGLYFAIAYLARSARISWLVSAAFGLIALGLALWFMTQFDYQNYPETPAFIQRLGKLTTILPDLKLGDLIPNAIATFLEMALPVALALTFLTKHWSRWLWAISSLVLTYALVLSVSRGSWLGLVGAGVIGLLVWWLRRLPRRIALLVSAGAILALLIAGALALGPFQARLMALLGPSAPSRLELYRNSLYLIGDYAITGIGLGSTFAMVYSRYGLLIFVPFLTYSHNLPLAVWYGQGLLGFMSFIGMVVLFYAYVYRVIRQVQPGILFHGAWLGVTATLIHGLTDARQYTESPWVMPALFFGMGLTIACGVQAARKNEEQVTAEEKPALSLRQRRLLAGIGTLLMLTAVGGVVLLNQALQATWYTNLGALDETRADTFISPDMDAAQRSALESSAQVWYEKALAINPNLPSANRRLGNLLVDLAQYAEAVPLLEKAAAAEPTNPAAIKGLGLAYVWVGRIEDAARTFEPLTYPQDIVSELYTWSTYWSQQKKPLLAAYAVDTALLISPDDNLDVWLLTANYYRDAGQLEQARDWYHRVLERDPNNQQAKDAIRTLGG